MSAAEFTPFAELLRVTHDGDAALVPVIVEVPPPPDPLQPECAAAIREVRLFRARALDAFDEAVARVLRELAADVLARELRLAPCDLAAIVARVRERIPALRVRVAPDDVPLIAGETVADAALQQGDAIVEIAGGALDARLGVRLATVMEAWT